MDAENKIDDLEKRLHKVETLLGSMFPVPDPEEAAQIAEIPLEVDRDEKGAIILPQESGREADSADQKLLDHIIDEYLDGVIKTSQNAYLIVRGSNALIFPPSQGLNINMMPFKLFHPKETLPSELHPYIDLILQCPVAPNDFDDFESRIAYLTVHESGVPSGQSQRRPGLHIESALRGTGAQARTKRVTDPSDWMVLGWGGGCRQSECAWPAEGIYMASSVNDSCIVYPALVTDPTRLADAHGGLPRCVYRKLEPGRRLAAGELCWMTDRTPHESLPLASDTLRQFFRLVVGPVGAWYSKHNTANPLGIAPDAPVCDTDKFSSLARTTVRG